MNKRIIICGPTASGKTFLRKRFEEKGLQCDVSYTSRKPREGEETGVHYHFISKEDFEKLIDEGFFYEWVEYNGNYYGTGLYEWRKLPLFIMETDGIKHIKPEDRKSCFVIYLDIPQIVRQSRMQLERGWSEVEAAKRIITDLKKFEGFIDYDLKITNSDF